MTEQTDRIEKKILLRAPQERVWRAISDAQQFGSWFGVELNAAFSAGARLKGRIVPTKVDPEVAKMQEPYTGLAFEIVVDRIEPMSHFSFRWHANAVDQNVDYSKEPMTLVTFELQAAQGGTLLTITESGFDQIPLSRRAAAFASNSKGWEAQTRLIEK